MRFPLGALLLVVIIGPACGPSRAATLVSPSPSVTSLTSPSDSAAPSPSPDPTPPLFTPGPWTWPTPQPVTGKRALAITSSDYSGSATTVTMITIDGRQATTRKVVSMPDLYVMDARGDLALVSVDQSTQLALLNLQSGQFKLLPVYSPGSIGVGRFSPDGTQAAVSLRETDLSYRLEIVTIRTGAVRTLITIAKTAYHGAGLDVLRWVASGIFVTPGVWDLLPTQVYRINPSTGALTLLTESRVQVTSPGAKMLAAPNYLNLGDTEFQGQGSWPNQLVEAPIGGPATVVAQHKNRAFYANDIADDGSLLYSVGGDASTTTPAADMGIYLYRGGQSVKVLSDSRVSQWEAWFVGPDQALAIQAHTVDSGSLEVDLVGLCSPGVTCTPTLTPVIHIDADLPVGYILALD